jgi:glycosyltransferase involved in cell wall biosynthesis
MATASPTDAVIRFEPDGYDLKGPRLLGRQSAGNGFLRAAVQGRGEGPVYGHTAHTNSAQMFRRMVREFDPNADPVWIAAAQQNQIGPKRGVLYTADPTLPSFARLRQRVGPGSYSLCGVTHTLASDRTLETIGDLLSEAVMPWDALVCTSTAALETVRRVLAAKIEFLQWRFGRGARLRLPQLPIIPLGVHTADFAFTDDEKASSRQALGIAPDEVVALYLGRLLFFSKAHPFPMFQGLQAAAERSGKKIVLLLCGRAPTPELEAPFLAGAAKYAPDVRTILVDSRDDDARRGAWGAGDIFVSLAEGIQETFGLTPIEAMAAGLPAVVTDWNGYRDTVRDEVDGFRIRTWAPEPGVSGEAYALRYELKLLDYDNYCWAAAAATSVDLAQLADRLTALVEQPDLRRRMGLAGQTRARETFDWAHVYRQYQALWGELNARRLAAAQGSDEWAWAEAAPRVPPSRLDPFHAFGHYPTSMIGGDTVVSLVPGATVELYRDRVSDDLFVNVGAADLVVSLMWPRLEAGPTTVAALAKDAKLSVGWANAVVGALAKMGVVRLDRPAQEA